MPAYVATYMRDIIRARILNALTLTKGVQTGSLFAATATKNIFEDKVTVAYGAAKSIKIAIELNAPIKIAKQLGWWRDGEDVPIIGYLHYIAGGYVPKRDDKITVASAGFMTTDYIIENIKMYGIEEALGWVMTLMPKRNPSE